jgi:hypothetical protein
MSSEFPDSRQGHLFTYIQIVFNQFTRWARLQDIDESNRPKAFPRFATWEQEIEGETRETRVMAIVSASLFLEAFIYDYIARKQSANLAQRLDKLDPLNKWLIATQMLCAPGISTDSKVYERITKLFKLRNQLVHHKSKAEGSVFDMPELPEDFLLGDCLDTIGLTLKLLSDLDPEEDVASLLLRHIKAWFEVAKQNPDFYPVCCNA